MEEMAPLTTATNKRNDSGINLGRYCIVKPDILCVALIPLSLMGSQSLSKFCFCWRAPPPSGRGSPCLFRPASHILLRKPSSPSCRYKACLPPHLLGHSAPRCSPGWLRMTRVPSSPGLWMHETNEPLSISSCGCCAVHDLTLCRA